MDVFCLAFKTIAASNEELAIINEGFPGSWLFNGQPQSAIG